MELIRSFFDGSYMPHGHCYYWQAEILWTHVFSDILIAISYFSIPVMLFLIKRQRKDWQFTRIFVLFSLFIFLCGITHVMSIFTIWHGIYGIHGVSKFITAIVSLSTAIVLFKLMPKILILPTIAQIEEANSKLAEEQIANSRLEAERESERLLRTSLNAAPVGLMTLDNEGTIHVVNKELCKMLGFQAEELINQSANTLFVEKTLLTKETIDTLLSTSDTFVFPSIVYVKTKNGDEIPVEIRSQSETNTNDKILFLSLIDQSFKLIAERTSSYLSAIVESCNDPIIGKDLSGHITHWNKAAERLYGYAEQEMIGESIYKIVPEDKNSEIEDILAKLKEGEQINHFETVRVKKDKTLVNVMLTISPIKNSQGKTIGGSIIVRDITDRLFTEKILEYKNKALQVSNRELENFAFIASHDLKEPLRKIISFGKLIQQEIDEKLSNESKDYLNYMIQATDRMQNLLDSLLAYSRVTSREKSFKPIDLNAVISDVTNDLELTINETNTRLTSDPLPVIQGDYSQLYQLFQNLITNSIKYRQESEPAHIAIRCLKNDDSEVIVSITDNGIGFEQQYAEQIFEMFKRLHGRNQYEGTGVGLAICRKIIELHHGKIEATSAVGQGTTVKLSFIKQEI